jgi:hypothetical protein
MFGLTGAQANHGEDVKEYWWYLDAVPSHAFTVGKDGRRPCFGTAQRMQQDPNWKDNVLFNEYFHGDTGAGLGASHQTGWTGVIADLIRRRHGAVEPMGYTLRTVDYTGAAR